MTQQGLYTEDDISNADINGLGLYLEKIKTSTENENCLIFLFFHASGYFYLSYPCNKVGEGKYTGITMSIHLSFCLALSISSEMFNLWQPNLVWQCIILRQCVMQRFWVLSSWSRSQHGPT